MAASSSMLGSSPKLVLGIAALTFSRYYIDWEDGDLLNKIRTVYYGLQVTSLVISLYIVSTVNSSKAADRDKTIYVPSPSSPLNPSTVFLKTTYAEHEKKQCTAMLSQLILAVAIVSFLHFRLGINHSLLLQSVTAPLSLYDNGLVQKYLLNSQARVFDEKFEDELTPEQLAEAEVASSSANGQGYASKSVGDLMTKTWRDKRDPTELVKALDDRTVNCRNHAEHWSPLMVVAGLKGDFRDALGELLNKGADVFITDNDGWTCLHWASFHGNVNAVRFLTESAREARYSVARLLSTKDSEGKTAAEVTQKEMSKAKADNNMDVMSALQDVAGALKNAEKRIRENSGPLDGLDD